MEKFLQCQKRWIIFFVFACLSFTGYSQYDAVVAKDGTGNYTTVQAAINAAPTGRTTPYRIFIKNGKYREKDTIPSNKPFIHLIGESVADVIISWDDYSGKPLPGGGTHGTSSSATFFVFAADFTAVNITFENTTGEAPQALAIYISGDRAAFKNCRFMGGQDTIFAGTTGARQYFRNCYIDGTVDFIFGDSRAVFDSTVIYAKTRSAAGSSFFTAANTKQAEPYGYVFRDCIIPANRGGTVYYLGRPWQNDASTPDASKSYNKTIFLNTTMSSSIHPAGWSTWDAGTDVTRITYAEYRSKKFDSTLVDVSQRVSWSKQLTAAEAATYYSNSNLFGTWDPCSVTADFCAYTPRPIAVSNFRGVRGSSTTTFTWNISWPIAGIKYEVLRSSDKVTFTKVSEQTSANDSTVNYNYTENVPPPGVTFYYLIQASRAGYNTHITDTVTISSKPTINVSGTLGNFVQGMGTPSNPQSYVVSTSSLTTNLIITAPSSYELSTNATTWNTSANPIVLSQDANGNIANTTIYIRLNASSAGTYNGNVIHASQGADTVLLAVNGTVQNEPLTVSEILQWHPMTVNSSDSAAVRIAGVTASTPTLSRFSESNGIQYDAAPLPAYSGTHGQALSGSPGGTGDWRTASGGPGGNLSRLHYEQFTVTAAAEYTIRVDSLILNNSFYNTSSNTRIAVQYSLSNFATDSSEISGGKSGAASVTFVTNNGFTKAVMVPQDNAATTNNFRFALSGTTGVTVPAGQTLTVRLYFSCGSTSTNRYVKIKDLMFKGLSTKNPATGDYRSKQTGNWTDLNTWERFDGTNWVHPAPEFPHFNNTSGTLILNGHIVTLAASFTEGFGYIPRRTRINTGGRLVVNSGANLNVANDGAPAAATTDLQVDGTLSLNGGMFTNGNVAIAVNGTFVNTSTSMNLSNGGDTVFVRQNGTWQQNNNSSNTPARFSFEPTSTFSVTGLTTAQTGLFKNNVQYGNIIWNNTGATAYYAVRATLDSSNVRGSFTVLSTGSTFLTFNQVSGRKVFPGGYYQTGGTVNFRESGTGTDTLDLGGDFNVTGGTFNSNEGAGSSLLIRLNGLNKTITYGQSTAANTNWQINGIYILGSNLTLPGSGFNVTVNGTLNTAAYYVVTNGTAFLKRNNIGTGNNVFPVGPATTSYNPVTINNAGSADNFSVNVKTTFDNPVPDPNRVVNRQWIINEEVAGESNVTLSLSWIAADQAAGFDPNSATSIIRFNGTAWESYPATITGAGTTADPYVATASGITAFSPFTVMNSSALPLNLLTFNAGYNNNKVNIWWTTVNELNTSSFTVERSTDGRTYVSLGSIAARNVTGQISYTYSDVNPVSGEAYYRLKMTDKDGSFRYSRVVVMNSRLIGKLSVFPNPATNGLTVSHKKAGTNAAIEIISTEGRRVLTQKVETGATQTSVDVSALPSGRYMLVINSQEKGAIVFIKL